MRRMPRTHDTRYVFSVADCYEFTFFLLNCNWLWFRLEDLGLRSLPAFDLVIKQSVFSDSSIFRILKVIENANLKMRERMSEIGRVYAPQ